MFGHLKKEDSLFALRVRDPQGRVLAAGLFPHDDSTLYFWSGASREDGHPLCPNDLMHWTVMRLAAGRGLRLYNMSGHGRFKRKFGGALTEVTRWHKSYWRTARWARHGYQAWFEALGTRKLWPIGLAWSNGVTTRAQAGATSAPRPAASLEIATIPQRPSFHLSDLYKSPLHDFPIRDEILYQYLPLSRNMNLLEIGPGCGVTAFRLARKVRSITLLDIASGNVSNLRRSLRYVRNLSFVCADVCEPGLAQRLGQMFDAVYALEVFELLADPRTCLKNLAAVTRPGGHLLLQFPNYPPQLSPGPAHFRTRRELGRLLEEAGFTAWDVGAVRLRRYASLICRYAHDKPIRVYRHHRRGHNVERPLVYDESWAFQHGQRLEAFKYALHIAWALLSGAMRLGGPAFAHTPLDDEILNHNLIVLAQH
jgi:2-polyprenyl-3-methyl-5-hydroxy-6-metoxy-1,4-benzoquinol methylase